MIPDLRVLALADYVNARIGILSTTAGAVHAPVVSVVLRYWCVSYGNFSPPYQLSLVTLHTIFHSDPPDPPTYLQAHYTSVLVS